MHRKVKGKVVFVDDTLLNHDLVEVCHHIIDASQVDHLHIETHGLVHIYHLYMHRVRTPQVWPFLFFVSSPDAVKHLFLCPLFLWFTVLFAYVLLTIVCLLACFCAFCLEAWLCLNDLVVDVVFGADEPLLNALDDLLPL